MHAISIFISIFLLCSCAGMIEEQQIHAAAQADHDELERMLRNVDRDEPRASRVETPRVESHVTASQTHVRRLPKRVTRERPAVERRTASVALRQMPEATMPCYIHGFPNGIPESDVITITNNMSHPVGLRLNGLPLQIVGATPPTISALLPAGVAVSPNLLPPEYKCYVVPYHMAHSLHFEAIMYRINPYNGTPQALRRGQGTYQIRYPRKWSWELVIDRMFF